MPIRLPSRGLSPRAFEILSNWQSTSTITGSLETEETNKDKMLRSVHHFSTLNDAQTGTYMHKWVKYVYTCGPTHMQYADAIHNDVWRLSSLSASESPYSHPGTEVSTHQQSLCTSEMCPTRGAGKGTEEFLCPHFGAVSPKQDADEEKWACDLASLWPEKLLLSAALQGRSFEKFSFSSQGKGPCASFSVVLTQSSHLRRTTVDCKAVPVRLVYRQVCQGSSWWGSGRGQVTVGGTISR